MKDTIYFFVKRNIDEILCFSYLIGFIVTYGHAYNSIYAAVLTGTSRVPGIDTLLGALASAFAWPLYISVQLWK